MTEKPQPPDDLMPVSIQREAKASICIEWNDQTSTRWTAGQLRKACPCATCREKRRGSQEQTAQRPAMLPVISAAEAQPLTIESMRPVGSYAYNIAFSDGHSSGIYPFATLYSNDANG